MMVPEDPNKCGTFKNFAIQLKYLRVGGAGFLRRHIGYMVWEKRNPVSN